ncbi:hypothetical protein, unlikely [Trypanosoma brucei gambiense DAL972]|uniref:Uncharacterized protein n=1 Tax=Trypanosoma brucei gambiense (strain MHOM/CI/86/DAL972) TaxID=679716 RepID=D0A600_TRYB9|nr:hypothetical protein, unlikely [Trypanosoma brucei gambiense DAL972]CBH17101.1 hypothetical protein, unlikely [Trypanosoma brucei gambiense DAL972]|eukprot:XP_011779365.1 hypothetical protein, unlikely [Trypanosoma brucei gambiense DAL972]
MSNKMIQISSTHRYTRNPCYDTKIAHNSRASVSSAASGRLNRGKSLSPPPPNLSLGETRLFTRHTPLACVLKALRISYGKGRKILIKDLLKPRFCSIILLHTPTRTFAFTRICMLFSQTP